MREGAAPFWAAGLRSVGSSSGRDGEGPSGEDQVWVGQAAAMGLRDICGGVEDLAVALRVAEFAVGDVPERVAFLDHVAAC